VFWIVMPAVLISIVWNIEATARDVFTPAEVALQCTGKVINTPEKVDHFDQLLKKTQK